MKHLKHFEANTIELQHSGHFYTCIHIPKLISRIFTIGKKYEEYVKVHRFHNNKVINDNGNFSIIEKSDFRISSQIDKFLPEIDSNVSLLKKLGIELYRNKYNVYFVKNIEFDDLIIKIVSNKYNL